jgi:hypothetical protein
MKRVTGIGGIFFKAKDTRKLQAWYKKHLGLPLDPAWGGWQFHWREPKNPKKKGYTVWSAFDAGTDYFKPSKKPFMFNFRVANLKRILAKLKRERAWGSIQRPRKLPTASSAGSWIAKTPGSSCGNRRGRALRGGDRVRRVRPLRGTHPKEHDADVGD